MAKLVDLAEIIGAALTGDPNADIHRARPFETASEGDLTLATKAAFIERIEESQASAIVVSAPVANCSRNLLIAKNPKLAFARAIEALHAIHYEALGVCADLIAGERTTLGKDLSVH